MIYVIQAGDQGPIKIGFAINPKNRISQLQTANPKKLRILKIINGGSDTEREIHKRLSAYRMNGEWFQPCAEVMHYIARLGVDVEYIRDIDRAFAIIWRDIPGMATDPCPFCFKRHTHGLGDGHRVAHCGLKEPVTIKVGSVTLCSSDGYILRTRNPK